MGRSTFEPLRTHRHLQFPLKAGPLLFPLYGLKVHRPRTGRDRMATLRFTDRKGNKKRTDEESVWMGLQWDKQVWKLNNNIFWNKQKLQELCHLQPVFHSVILSSFFSWLPPNVISTWSSQPDVTSTANVSRHKNRPYITGKSQWTRTAVQSHIAILMPKAPYCSLSKCTYWVSTGTSPTSLSYQPCEPHPHHIQGSYPQKKQKTNPKDAAC